MNAGTIPAYREVDEAMRRGVEILAELAAMLAELPAPPAYIDSAAIERVHRRAQNAAAQLELDRRLIAEIRGREG